MLNDFQNGVLKGTSDVLGRRSIPLQLQGLNESVANMLHMKNKMLQQLVSLNNSNNEMRTKIQELTKQVERVQDVTLHLATQNRLLMVRMEEVLRALGREPASLPEPPMAAQRTQEVVNHLMRPRAGG